MKSFSRLHLKRTMSFLFVNRNRNASAAGIHGNSLLFLRRRRKCAGSRSRSGRGLLIELGFMILPRSITAVFRMIVTLTHGTHHEYHG